MQERGTVAPSRENDQATERTTGPTSENEVAQQQQDIEDFRNRLRDAYAAGEISEAEYDAAMDAVWEQAGVEGEDLLEAWDRMDEDDGWERYSVNKDDTDGSSEEILTETAVGDDGNIYLPGGPVPEAVKRMRAKGLDRASNAAYDGGNQKGVADYGRTGIDSKVKEDAGRAVWDGNRRAETDDRGEKDGILEAFRGDKGRDTQRNQQQGEIPEWANGHLTEVPKTEGCRQAKLAGNQYVEEVYFVKHDALQAAKSRNNKVVWGITENGIVFLSDQVPDNIGISVGFHEVVHVAKQKDFQLYADFWNRTVT